MAIGNPDYAAACAIDDSAACRAIPPDAQAGSARDLVIVEGVED